MPEQSKYDRLGFLRNAGIALAGAQLAAMGPASAQVRKLLAANVPATTAGAHTSFASLKQIDAGYSMSDMPKPARPTVSP